MPVTVHARPAGSTACDTQDQSITDLYYSASWQVLEELQDGNETVRNTWSPVYVNALLTREDDTDADGTPDRTLHATQDATFNVTGIFDDANAGQEHLVYSAYGQKQVTDGTWTVQSGETLNWKVTYQGGEEDLATGNINFQRRDYNPRTYTWSSADPLGTPDGPSRYAFVAGNPINYRDPEGLWTIHRDKHALAEAVPEDGDTIQELAVITGLNVEEWQKWLTVREKGNAHISNYGHFYENSPLYKSNCEDKFFVPNRIVIDYGNSVSWEGYMWAPVLNVFAQFRQHAEWIDERMTSKGYLVDNNMGVSDADIISHLIGYTMDKSLSQYVFFGHGADGEINTARKVIQGLEPKKYTKYGIEYMYLYACESLVLETNDVSWKNNVSRAGRVYGYTISPHGYNAWSAETSVSGQ